MGSSLTEIPAEMRRTHQPYDVCSFEWECFENKEHALDGIDATEHRIASTLSFDAKHTHHHHLLLPQLRSTPTVRRKFHNAQEPVAGATSNPIQQAPTIAEPVLVD
jgi:hypothetical protein